MDDLEERIANRVNDAPMPTEHLLDEALDRLRTYREAIQPFADCCEQIGDEEDDEEWAKFRLLIKDYRRAAKAIRHDPA